MTNRRAFSVVCAAILTVAFALRPAAAQSLLGRCDKLVSDAEAMGKKVVDCKKALSSGHSATPDFAKAATTPTAPSAAMMDVVIATGSIPTDVASAAMAEPKLVERLAAYYSYLAFDAKNPDLCAPLAPVRSDNICRDFYGDLSFRRGIMGTSAEFLKACNQNAVADFLTISRAKLGEFCSIIGQNKANAAAACPKLIPLSKVAPAAGSCETYLSDSTRPGACDGLDEEHAAECKENALFGQAFKAGDIGKCGASPRCRVLMGAGKQVVAEQVASFKSPAAQWFLKGGARPIVKKVPVPVAQPGATPPAASATQQALNFQGFTCIEPLQSAENRKAVTGVLTAARLCLKDVESALTAVDVETSKAIDARSEKLARLEIELTPTFEPAKSAKAPAKAPK